ncbi:hypothetical protein [Burkholderia cepacia]|uniref:zinc-ribbon domain-containing protein n=1 Tax=Burkholderia cepacia TaxID=292 RepID=UPI000B006F96|nr:hypothetical protein [Burkholderia cepacia]
MYQLKQEFRQQRLDQAKEHAISKGGQCLSTEYQGCKGKLLWKCGNPTHKEWAARFDKIVQENHWCPECANQTISLKLILKDGLDRAKKHAQGLGGQCLSTEYKGSRDKLLWKCHNQDHKEWDARFDQVVQRGVWCPECGLEKQGRNYREFINIDKAKNHANSKDGSCLSDVYINNEENLAWKCDNPKHAPWFDSYQHVVKFGRWCPHCRHENEEAYKKNRLNLARQHAQMLNGRCLSTEYKGSGDKLLWKCSNDAHEPWKATYANIVREDGTWCPECAKKESSQKKRANLKESLHGLDTTNMTAPQIKDFLSYKADLDALRSALRRESIPYQDRRGKSGKRNTKNDNDSFDTSR